MGHTIIQGPHPNIVIQKLEGELTWEDMTAAEALGLTSGKPVYVLLDTTNLNIGLPVDFVEGAKQSYFTHPGLQHMALYTTSSMLGAIGRMVAKLTGKKEHLSVHTDYSSAINHLLDLIALSEKR